MRQCFLGFAFMVLIPLATGCGNQDSYNSLYTQADSLLTLTLVLQSRIGSPEIQRMHEFQAEINQDMSVLREIESENSSLEQYRELQNGLGQCMEACNQFHEEAYLLESSLRDIMEKAAEEGMNKEELEGRLIYEKENFIDLSIRTDSSLDRARLQAGIFYKLKPEIDKIMDESEMP